MDPRSVKTAEDAAALIKERKIDNVKVGVFDVDGVMRGKYMSREKFLSALTGGFGFCDVVLGWDSNDQLYDNAKYTGWHTAYPDAPVRVLPDTCREIPFEPSTLLFLAEFADKAEPVCPRGTLRRVVKRAADMGFSVMSAAEFEFFVFEETPDSVREKNYKNLKNITPGFFGYSMLRNSVHAEFYHHLLDTMRKMDVAIEGLHTETGAGVLEAAIGVDSMMASADKASIFKTYTKILAQRQNRMATFMAKWSHDWPGQSGHLHISLQDKKGKSAFHDPKKPHNISDTMRHFIGGQQMLMPELLSMIACTVNSYTRLIPGFWAPTASMWGVENRTTALRVIPGSSKSQRVEYRVAAADINPYIAFSAALGSGLWGIENKIEPTKQVQGNAYAVEAPAKLQLPRTLGDAAKRLAASKAAKELFGEAFVEHYAGTRDWEQREYNKAITDWQLQRYFEII
ncbi:MAG: glutamine synthetase [Proteobacteria bacterium]|nr:glutamine synthetase [Pseudomonadota bacterium]